MFLLVRHAVSEDGEMSEPVAAGDARTAVMEALRLRLVELKAERGN